MSDPKPLKELLEEIGPYPAEGYAPDLAELLIEMARRLRALDDALDKYVYKCEGSDVLYAAEVRAILDGRGK